MTTMAMLRRVSLGEWTCPSGNNVQAFYRPVGNGLAMVEMAWDEPPPLAPADERHYVQTIRPALLARIREYTEATGAALVVTP